MTRRGLQVIKDALRTFADRYIPQSACRMVLETIGYFPAGDFSGVTPCPSSFFR
jgi:hypothetical protein